MRALSTFIPPHCPHRANHQKGSKTSRLALGSGLAANGIIDKPRAPSQQSRCDELFAYGLLESGRGLTPSLFAPGAEGLAKEQLPTRISSPTACAIITTAPAPVLPVLTAKSARIVYG
jgi:hypothetical protein